MTPNDIISGEQSFVEKRVCSKSQRTRGVGEYEMLSDRGQPPTACYVKWAAADNAEDLRSLRREDDYLQRVRGLPDRPKGLILPTLLDRVTGSRAGQRVHALVLSPIGGIPLDLWCRQAPPGRRLALFDTLYEVFEWLRAHGLQHGDIKPSNILVCADDQVALLDFESACTAEDCPPWLRRTPGFSPPEDRFSLSRDRFALCILLRDHILAPAGQPGRGEAPDLQGALEAQLPHERPSERLEILRSLRHLEHNTTYEAQVDRVLTAFRDRELERSLQWMRLRTYDHRNLRVLAYGALAAAAMALPQLTLMLMALPQVLSGSLHPDQVILVVYVAAMLVPLISIGQELRAFTVEQKELWVLSACEPSLDDTFQRRSIGLTLVAALLGVLCPIATWFSAGGNPSFPSIALSELLILTPLYLGRMDLTDALNSAHEQLESKQRAGTISAELVEDVLRAQEPLRWAHAPLRVMGGVAFSLSAAAVLFGGTPLQILTAALLGLLGTLRFAWVFPKTWRFERKHYGMAWLLRQNGLALLTVTTVLTLFTRQGPSEALEVPQDLRQILRKPWSQPLPPAPAVAPRPARRPPAPAPAEAQAPPEPEPAETPPPAAPPAPPKERIQAATPPPEPAPAAEAAEPEPRGRAAGRGKLSDPAPSALRPRFPKVNLGPAKRARVKVRRGF